LIDRDYDFHNSDILTRELEHHPSLAQAEFVDGKLTKGWHAKLVKNNQQLKHSESTFQKRNSLKALNRNALFQMAVRPRIVHSILFSRYDTGMSHGRHTDNALMGDSFLRSDVSFTLFLNSPSAYEGGVNWSLKGRMMRKPIS